MFILFARSHPKSYNHPKSTIHLKFQHSFKKNKERGVNKCTEVANLKDGERLEVDIYNCGPVGENQRILARHMGRIVRDRSICPVRVHGWKEIDETAKEHMWQAVRVRDRNLCSSFMTTHTKFNRFSFMKFRCVM